jgi:hypothetical protein
MSDKIKPQHVGRKGMLYVRQSSAYQVIHNLESQRLQYAMQDRLRQLGWREIEVVDEDLGHIGGVAAREVSRFARNSREWQHLVESVVWSIRCWSIWKRCITHGSVTTACCWD